MNSQQEREIREQVVEIRGKLEDLNADLRAVDGEFEGLATQRMQYELLDQACGSLEKLRELGVSDLFWGDRIDPELVAKQLRDVRVRLGEFQEQLGELDARHSSIQAGITTHEENLAILGEDLYEIREAEERRKQEWIVEREISSLPPRLQRMAWARGGEDDRRFRKSLGGSLLASFALGALFPMIDLPLPKRFVAEDIPKRLAQLVREEQTKLVTPPPKPETAEQDQQDPEKQKPQDEPELAESKPQEAKPGPLGQTGDTPNQAPGPPRQNVQQAGILAFKDKFASLNKDDVARRLGANARYGDADEASRAEAPTRSMLTTNAPGSSGGINVASLSRNVGGGGGGGGGGGIQGVQVGQAQSSIAGIGGGGRPLAGGGPGASRTDEEIQIVFDRYKASFYRLYNRELRNDPTLRGQMVLRLTIEPDGSVSMCKLQSSDMDAPELAAQVVSRVLQLNFGAEDVEAMTIVYPIDFLPAS